MESPPGRRLRRSPPADGSDLISALPDEVLRLVLERISCARSIVQTGLLSRRWRGLWTGLVLIVHDLTPAATEALLAVAPPVSALHIRLFDLTAQEASSLLSAAALLSPVSPAGLGLAFILKRDLDLRDLEVELPCFNRAISIDLDAAYFRIRPPAAGDFTSLESLSFKGEIVDLVDMLHRCPRLRTISLAFRGVVLDSVEAALTSLEVAAPSASVRLLDIRIQDEDRVSAPRFASLLRAMARVSLQQLVLTDWRSCDETLIHAELPSFNRARSIQVMGNICFTQRHQLPTAAEFSTLEELSLSGCRIDDLATLLARCPRLRVLTLTVDEKGWPKITVHSTTLQELHVYSCTNGSRSIDIVTPVLQELMLEVEAFPDLSVSISAPLVEKVTWERSYVGLASVFGFWSLGYMSLNTVDEDEHVLSLHISANDSVGAELDLALELEKILVTESSMLELHLKPSNHVFGALVSRLLGMHHIRTATETLTIILEHCSKATRQCRNCPCDEPKNWRIQNLSLPRLQGVEIEGFNGEHSHLELLKMLLRSAPMLKTVTLKLEYGLNRENFRGGFRKIYNSFLAYPCVSYSVYANAGGELWHVWLPCS